jgi:hypothetical protein
MLLERQKMWKDSFPEKKLNKSAIGYRKCMKKLKRRAPQKRI